MFNDKYNLTQAVLNGRKTMTRRVITDKKLHYWKCSCPDMVIVKIPELQKLKVGDDNSYFGIKDKISSEYYCDIITSPYKVGEVVAIAQSYKDIADPQDEAQNVLGLYKVGDKLLSMEEMVAGWNNKLFVKSCWMPHHIRITNVKIERLQDISDDECLKEGIYEDSGDDEFPPSIFYEFEGNKDDGFDTPLEAFAALIDKVSGKGSFQSNPYVFAYEFELID